jgi:hypothetical protein
LGRFGSELFRLQAFHQFAAGRGVMPHFEITARRAMESEQLKGKQELFEKKLIGSTAAQKQQLVGGIAVAAQQ